VSSTPACARSSDGRSRRGRSPACAQLAAYTEAVVDAIGEDELEVHGRMGHEIPLLSICALLGIPVEDRRRIDEFMVGTE
jgi:hypothetical protein